VYTCVEGNRIKPCGSGIAEVSISAVYMIQPQDPPHAKYVGQVVLLLVCLVTITVHICVSTHQRTEAAVGGDSTSDTKRACGHRASVVPSQETEKEALYAAVAVECL